MFRRLVLTALLCLGLVLTLTPAPASAAAGDRKTHDCGRVGADFGPDIKVCYRMVYAHQPSFIPSLGYARPRTVRFKIAAIPWYKGGGMPFNASWVIFHVRIIDDEAPPLAETVTHRTFKMRAFYYNNTFNLETTPRVYGKNPRFCVRVQIRINFDRDIHRSLKCTHMTTGL